MVGKRLYFGQVFRGNKIAECMELPGVIMGKLANGRTFILNSAAKFTVR